MDPSVSPARAILLRVAQDEITQAVLAREEVVRYLEGRGGLTRDQARTAIHGYLDELRTTQRYRM
ncbi:MAG: hypothetical protein OXG72_18275 [Acidobacteria bacterium]|nr:hypothetical protein [Acidobacteriota bacterium]